MSLIPAAPRYIGRHTDYDPEVLCEAKKAKVIANVAFDLTCELVNHHDAKYHNFRFDSETRITWI